jgi:hypothetical protein
MSIIVVCTECRKSFKVSDKFAGKSGPCPNCKTVLHVPNKSEEVTIHAPAAFAEGGRTKAGKLITKPIPRATVKLSPVAAVAIAGGALLTMGAAWLGGQLKLFDHRFVSAAALLAVSLPLVIAAYSVLRDDELEPYRGAALYTRTAICGAGYAILWGLFSQLSAFGYVTGEIWNWVIVVPAFVAAGGLIAFSALDLEYGSGVLHYGFYLAATVILGWLATGQWAWNVASG